MTILAVLLNCVAFCCPMDVAIIIGGLLSTNTQSLCRLVDKQTTECDALHNNNALAIQFQLSCVTLPHLPMVSSQLPGPTSTLEGFL